MAKLSAVIITFNEERNIGRCLESLRHIADEVVVVDSFSTDRTREICIEHGARFEQHAFEGYIEQKNYALSRASHDFVISLDADEALSPLLAESVLKVKQSPGHDGYTMNRLTSYCGKWIRHSGWYPDTKLRLIDRRKGTWKGVNPHDKLELVPGSTISHLQGDLLHYSYYSVEEHKRQVEKFASIAATALFRNGTRSGIAKRIYKPAARFFKSYLLKLGFLDGREGWIIALQTARSSYLRYTILHKLHQEKQQ